MMSSNCETVYVNKIEEVRMRPSVHCADSVKGRISYKGPKERVACLKLRCVRLCFEGGILQPLRS